MMRRALPSLLLAGMMAVSGGCSLFGRKPKVQPPPAPMPAPAPAPAPVPVPEPEPEPTPPPTPPPQPRPAAPKPKPAPAPVPAPAPKPPAFGQILTPQQTAEANRAYESSSRAARASLDRIAGRALTRDQLDSVTRIRSFLKQAEDARATDPATAAQLARRAEILANDLALSLR